MELDINTLVQSYNDKISQLMSEIITKDTMIRQMSAQLTALKSSLVPQTAPMEAETSEKQPQKKQTKAD